MSAISGFLEKIRTAIYGREVRESIAGGIEQCYKDAVDVVKVSEDAPTGENVKLWVKPTGDEYKVPTWEEFEETTGDVEDLKSALSQMSDIPDSIRKTNQISDAQYADDFTFSGVTVHAVKYSGFQLTGELASGGTIYLSRGVLNFVYGKTYSLLVTSDVENPKFYFGLRTTNPAGWVKNTSNKNAITFQADEPFVFSPKESYTDCYLGIYNPTNSAIFFNNAPVFYVYVFEGDYTGEQISVYRDLIGKSSKTSFDGMQFAVRREMAIRSNGWQSLDYSNIEVYKDQYYMKSDGTFSFAQEHRVMRITDAGGIYRLRFVLKKSISSPLFVVTDENGVVKNTYERSSWQSQYLNTNLYMVFPGGLAEGSTIYINWFDCNASGHASDYVDHIDIQYEKEIAGQPNGKDLFDPSEAMATGSLYFDYASGLQVASSTYCAGECRIKAGDVFRTYMNCHIAYYDEYGKYITASDVSTGSTYHTYTAPAGTNGAMISCRIADVSIFSVDRDEMHFIVPINQNVIKTGENTASAVDDESSMVNVNAVLKLPRQYSFDGNPVPVIAIIHGSGFSVSDTEWGSTSEGSVIVSTPFDNMINLFTQSGYAVCDINGYDNSVPNNTWGSQRGIMAYRKMIDYVLAKYNVQKTVNVYGFSMGGLVALNFLNMNADIVKCAAIASPVVALYDQVYNGGSSNWKNQMIASYGFDGTSWDDNAFLTVGYDPYTRVITVNDKKYNLTDYPFMRIWHGTADSAVPAAKSAELVEFIRNSGKDCTYRAVTNAGHEICYGGNSICNNEYVCWFDRFNKKGS